MPPHLFSDDFNDGPMGEHLFNIQNNVVPEGAIPSPRSSTVGFSIDRTPAKHALMYKLFGKEVGVAHKNRKIGDLLWLDLTAGDGVAKNGGEWTKNCSPGILAYHARMPEVRKNKVTGDYDPTGKLLAFKPTRVELYEISQGTYSLLLDALVDELPTLGYQRVSDSRWQCGPVTLSVHNTTGEMADLAHRFSSRTAVRVNNDPNSIKDWAMDLKMPERIRDTTPWFLGVCTMGCNVGGLKRLLRKYPEEADRWYESVDSVVAGLPDHHDLYLCAIEQDASQWAYLIIAPSKASPDGTDWRVTTESEARKCFQSQGMRLRGAWLGSEVDEFRAIQDYLFTIKKRAR